MSCVAAKITYRTCGHTAQHILSCRCGLGVKYCRLSLCRVILSTVYLGSCDQDIKDAYPALKWRLNTTILADARRLGLYGTGQDNEEDWDELLQTRFNVMWKQTRKKLDAMLHESRMAKRWTVATADFLHTAMFGDGEDFRALAEEELRTQWRGKPMGLAIVEHGLLSRKEIVRLRRELDETKERRSRWRLVDSMQLSDKPPVPLFAEVP